MSYIICLPTYGAPYIWEGKTHTKIVETCRKVVQGGIEQLHHGDINGIAIHPMFVKENPRWAVAQRLIDDGAKIYLNDEGRTECCANMGTIALRKQFSGGMLSMEILKNTPYTSTGVPYFGDIALVVAKSKFEKIADPETMTLVEECYEPEDEEEEEAKKKECDENGWEYHDSTGQIFKKKAAVAPRPITIRRKKTTAAAIAGAKAAVAAAK